MIEKVFTDGKILVFLTYYTATSNLHMRRNQRKAKKTKMHSSEEVQKILEL